MGGVKGKRNGVVDIVVLSRQSVFLIDVRVLMYRVSLYSL